MSDTLGTDPFAFILVALGLDSKDTTKSNFSVYREYFETPFIDATEVYYKTESEKFISENSVPDYMKKVKLGLKKALDMDHTHCFT
jgi:cullin 1